MVHSDRKEGECVTILRDLSKLKDELALYKDYPEPEVLQTLKE